MSEENVAIVRRIYAAWEDGSPASSGLLSEEIEWVNPSEAVEQSTRRGLSAFSEAAASISTTFEDARVHFESFIDAGDRVVVIGTLRGRGHGSGIRSNGARDTSGRSATGRRFVSSGSTTLTRRSIRRD